MAKNKVYLTVLVALLAGCAVLIGCAGEGAYDVSKSVDNSMSVSDNPGGEIPFEPIEVGGTETQWETKQYWTGTIDEDFDGYSVVLIMDKNVGGPNKVHDKSFFGGIEIESIRDLTWFDVSYDNLGIDWGIWRQLLCLTLPGDSKENVVRAIRHLEKIEGIRYAGPGHIERPALFIEEVEENDSIGKNPGKPIFPVLPPQELGTFPGLDVETERLVKLDYLNYLGRSFGWSVAGLYDRTFDQIRILRYYGTYNGCVVVIMDADDLFYAQMNTFITVAGLKFGWGDSNVALVWKRGESPSSGNFYRLNEAYDLGVLSLEDIKNLYGRYFDYPYEEKESLSMPDHLCDFYGQKIPNCNFDGCDW